MTEIAKELSLPKRAKNFIKYRIVHADDSPHRIALGVSLGLFTAFTPFLGLHTITAVVLAFIIRANKAVTLLCSWINNPFTVIPIFVSCHLLGKSIIGLFKNVPASNTAEVAEYFNHKFSLPALITPGFWEETGNLFAKIGLELFIGCVILGTVVGVAAYFLSYKAIVVCRLKHQRSL